MLALIVLGIVVLLLIAKMMKDTSNGSSDNQINNNPTVENQTSSTDLRVLEISYLKTAVAPDLIPYANIEIAGIENLATSSDSGKEYLKLRVYGGQPKKNNGIRSEVSIDYPYKEGDTVEYSWQFRIPENFQSDAANGNRWWVFADWHDQPDKNKGETWDTYTAHSAPIIFGYGYLNGKDQLSLSTGIDGSEKGIVPRGLIPITKNTWHTVRMVVKWSQKENGSVKVYFDGATSPTISTTGPNMLNAYQHYMKVGQYRNPDIETDNTINLRNITIKKI